MKKNLFILLFFSIVAIFVSSANNNLSIVKVDGGKMEGIWENDIHVFKGIPFAAPPVDELRWKAPQPVQNWDGILKADKFAPSCPQITLIPGSNQLELSEDCLYLNIWTPAKSANDKLPVMVWIYGGGFAMGLASLPLYSGDKLAKNGVILVTITYRVGALGFLAHPELTAESSDKVSGNYGLLDQKYFGVFSDRILEAYPANTIDETYYSAADIFRETAFAWPTYAWANLQSATGKSEVFVYYFDQPQPQMPFIQMKSRGAAHASEMDYVFGHLVAGQRTENDFKLSEMMIKYWTNFAKYGNPNGENLPEWETYSKDNPFVLLLRDTPQKIDLPNKDKLLLMEEYFRELRINK